MGRKRKPRICRVCNDDLVIDLNYTPNLDKHGIITCVPCWNGKVLEYSKKPIVKERTKKNMAKHYASSIYKVNQESRLEKFYESIEAGIYGIFSDCKLIYIGESKKPYRRKTQHFSKYSNLKQAKLNSNVGYALTIGELQRDRLRFKMLEFIDDTQARKERELCLIQRYNPIYN